MQRRSILVVLAGALALFQGCATTQSPDPVPQGPTAIVSDSVTGGSQNTLPTLLSGGRSSGNFFALAEYDGKPVRNAISASQLASRGRGSDLQVQYVERPVPAGKVKLKLVGRRLYAAPIQEMFSNAPPTAEGVVEVELQAGKYYRVVGVLDSLRSEVWLEELESQKMVSGKIVGARSAEAKKAQAADMYYTCCNLHYDTDGWISDANWNTQPFVPAGTPIKVYEYGRNRAKAMIGEEPMWLGLDYGRNKQTLQEFVSKIAVRTDPSARIAGYPEAVRSAIREGVIVRGMSKEQVLVALGYPRMDMTASLDAPRWLYTTLQDEVYAVVFSAEQGVVRVDASPGTQRAVMRGD